jgi:hypothetical protein
VPKVLQHEQHTVCLCRREQQVHLIAHQYLDMNRAAEFPRELGEVVKRAPLVFLGKETGTAVIPTLNEVQRYTRDRTLGTTRSLKNTVVILGRHIP